MMVDRSKYVESDGKISSRGMDQSNRAIYHGSDWKNGKSRMVIHQQGSTGQQSVFRPVDQKS